MMTSNEKTVTFIDRSRSSDYRATKNVFTLKEFSDHVMDMTRVAMDLQAELAVPADEIHQFVLAASKSDSKTAKSPVPPSSNS
jgi:hypothetical protein